MIKPLTRRDALKAAAAASVAAALYAEDSPLQIANTPVALRLTSVTPRTLRLTLQPLDASGNASLQDGALVRDDWGTPSFEIKALSGTRTLKCGDFAVEVSGVPLSLKVSTAKGDLIQQLGIDQATGHLSFSLGSGPLFGLGQGGPEFDRRGSLDRMNSGQAGYHLSTNGAKVPIQLLIGSSGWALFIHSPLGEFDLTGERGVLKPAHASLPLDLFVISTPDPPAILAEYAALTGHPEMVPLWSLGYQQSHRTLASPAEIIEEARLFRQKQLPCDAMIYLGTGFCPEGWNTDNGEFNWNPRMFPQPAKAIDELHAQHLKVVLHIVIEGEHLRGTVHDPCTAPPLPSGKTPDKHWPPDRQVSCYWPAHKPLFDLGIDGWWPDQGDGFDAASRLARNRMYFEGSQMYRPNERVYALHRNAYAGMQRYAAFLWSGDVQSTWQTLKTHVSVGINAGLSGIPYWGTDIGGFVPTEEYTGELFARWFQFAAFNPLFRAHGRDWRLHLPWGWTVGEIGYPETPGYHPDQAVLHNPAIEPICKQYLELRYRMLPYLYSIVKQCCATGLPIMRALWLHYPHVPAAVARGDEYLYGRDLLVAPVIEKGATARTLYLPPDVWYDYWTNEKVAGGREVTRPVDLATIPLYCRAGTILPLGPLKQYTEEKVDGPVNLQIYPGADGQFSLYADDGRTFRFRDGAFMQIDMSWNDRARRLDLRLAPGSRMLDSEPRFAVHVVGEPATRDVAFKGKPASLRL